MACHGACLMRASRRQKAFLQIGVVDHGRDFCGRGNKKAHAIPAWAPKEIQLLLVFGVTGLAGSTQLLDTSQSSIHVFLGNRCSRRAGAAFAQVLHTGIGPDLIWTATVLHHYETGFRAAKRSMQVFPSPHPKRVCCRPVLFQGGHVGLDDGSHQLLGGQWACFAFLDLSDGGHQRHGPKC